MTCKTASQSDNPPNAVIGEYRYCDYYMCVYICIYDMVMDTKKEGICKVNAWGEGQIFIVVGLLKVAWYIRKYSVDDKGMCKLYWRLGKHTFYAR